MKILCLCSISLLLMSCGGGSGGSTDTLKPNQKIAVSAVSVSSTTSLESAPTKIQTACEINITKTQGTTLTIKPSDSIQTPFSSIQKLTAHTISNMVVHNNSLFAIDIEKIIDREKNTITDSYSLMTINPVNFTLIARNSLNIADIHNMRFDINNLLNINVFGLGRVIQFDVFSNLNKPIQLNKLTLSDSGSDAIIDGNILYQANGDGLVSNDLNAAKDYEKANGKTKINTMELCGHQAVSLGKANDVLLVAARQGGIYSVDISSHDGKFSLVDHYQPQSKDFTSFDVDGKYGVAKDFNSVEIFDLSSPQHPISSAVIQLDAKAFDPIDTDTEVEAENFGKPGYEGKKIYLPVVNIETVTVNDGYVTAYILSQSRIKSGTNGHDEYIFTYKLGDPLDASHIKLFPIVNSNGIQLPKDFHTTNAVYFQNSIILNSFTDVVKLAF